MGTQDAFASLNLTVDAQSGLDFEGPAPSGAQIDRGAPLTFTTGPHTGATVAATTDTSHGIATFDKISVQVQTRTRQRTYNAITRLYSPWSAWGPWSAHAEAAHDLDHDGDELGNGIEDDIVGCPIPSTPPINNPQSADPSHIPATYPPGHPEPYTDANGNGSHDAGESFTDINNDGSWTADLDGHPTGHCYPSGSPCLPVAQGGSGVADVVCLPRGRCGRSGELPLAVT